MGVGVTEYMFASVCVCVLCADDKEYCVPGTAANHTYCFWKSWYVQFFVIHNHPKISTLVGCTVAGLVKLLDRYHLIIPAWDVVHIFGWSLRKYYILQEMGPTEWNCY